MTAYATCNQCTYCFVTHSEHPVPPPHDVPGTQMHCTGSDKPALTGVS